MPKRQDYISWDEYFMGIAMLSAKRSKDPNTQVGACIVNQNNKIMSVGYNGFPLGCSDEDFPWERSGDNYDTKYPYVCHAELSSTMQAATSTVAKSTLPSSHAPNVQRLSSNAVSARLFTSLTNMPTHGAHVPPSVCLQPQASSLLKLSSTTTT